jgi:periplasmic divalent cation tolerance protein
MVARNEFEGFYQVRDSFTTRGVLMDIVVCLVTCPSKEVGQALAKQVVAAQLAACVNILPGVQSVYHWEDSLCIDEEVLLIIKSTAARIEPLERTILEHHPYDTPEFVVLTASHVSERYAAWVGKGVGAA